MYEKLSWPEGLDVERFLQEYWQQRPVLLPQALPGFVSPLTPDELGGLALDQDIHSRLILRQRGENADCADQWHLRQGPFSEDELTRLPEQDWTLLVSDIEKHLDGFNSYLEPFRFLPDWRIDDLMVSYAPAGASAGAHVDEYDVFLLQAAGQRRWEISTDNAATKAFLPDQDLKILQAFSSTETWTLSPGDILYLPPGIPHHGIALDNDCMTWSIGFRAPMQHQLLTDVAEQLLAVTLAERYRDPALHPMPRKGELDVNTLDHLKALWLQTLHSKDSAFEHALGCVLTRRQDASDDDPAIGAVGIIPKQGELHRDAAARLLFHDSATGADLYVDGEHYAVSCDLAEELCANLNWEAQVLHNLCADSTDQECLTTLWHRGIVHVLEP